jgi:hypothetical protein
MPDANPTLHLRQSWAGGHFGNDCRLLATNQHKDAALPSTIWRLVEGCADREMPHKWWIFRRILAFDGGFLPPRIQFVLPSKNG